MIKFLTPFLWLCSIVLFIYLGLMLAMWFMQDKLIYSPYKDVQSSPRDIGLEYQELQFPAQDGTRLHAWFIPGADASGPVLLFSHGNAGNIGHRLQSLKHFHETGLGVLIYDYRGYGDSEGRPYEEGLYSDVIGAYQYLTKDLNVAPERIFSLGRSLGGPVAAYLAANRPVAGLILDATFTDMRDLGAQKYPWLPVRRLSRNHFPTREFLQASKVPVLIFHGIQDELVPFSHGQALQAAAGTRGQFIPLSGYHNDAHLVSHKIYTSAIQKFVNTYTKHYIHH